MLGDDIGEHHGHAHGPPAPVVRHVGVCGDGPLGGLHGVSITHFCAFALGERLVHSLQRCNHVIHEASAHAPSARPPRRLAAGRPARRRRCRRMVRRPPARRLVHRDPTVIVDREEITVIGRLPEVDDRSRERGPRLGPGRAVPRGHPRPNGCASPTRRRPRYGRKVSWGVDVGTPEAPERILFTHIAVPVMTRLKQPERQVLDTLVDAGVARSRSDALAWSVQTGRRARRGVAGQAARAMTEVDDLRAEGPGL